MNYTNDVKLSNALNVAIAQFKNYQKNLENRIMMVIYRNRTTNELDYILIEFTGTNYYHLTGLAYKEDTNDSIDGHFGSRFYNALVNQKLSIRDLKIKDNNTELKIKALPSVTTCYKYTKMIGDFNNSGFQLALDKVMGNTTTCLGLKKIKNKKYAPASSLYTDTRKMIKNSQQIIAIFLKDIFSTHPFSEIKYVAKGCNLKNMQFPNSILELISLENYHPPITKQKDQ